MAVRILFIDDDRAGTEVSLCNLRKAGYEVTPASDGREALALFETGKFDLVITDVKMPGISGIEVLRRIRKMDPGVPMFVITAFGKMETAVKAMQEGACYFLGKPFGRDQLLLVVERVLQRNGMADEARELSVPDGEVERGIVCVFPRPGGSLRLATDAYRDHPARENEDE